MNSSKDIQLVIRARDEASRALNSIATELDALLGKQEGLTRSGPGVSSSIAGMVAQLAQFEKVSGLVAGAADRAEAAITRTRQSMQANAAELAAVNAQIANAQNVIARGQQATVATLFKGGDASAQIAQVKAAQGAVVELEAQQRRLTGTVAAQQATLGEQERAFREVASMANSAEAAVSNLAAANTMAEKSARALAAINSSTNSRTGKSAEESASVFKASGLTQVEREIAAFEQLQARVDPVAAIHRKLAADIDLARKAMDRGVIDAHQFAQAEAELTRQAKAAEDAVGRQGRGAAGRPSLFGLKPYELTNLGYQFNDVVSGLAMGQRPMQILAQQGGQILQLLPNIGSKLVAVFSNPVFLGATAVFGGIALGIKRASDNAEELRKIEGILAQMGDNAGVSAEHLAEVVDAMKDLGLTSEQALGILRDFVTQGLNPGYLQAFAQAARDTARATGVDLKDAVKDMEGGFTRGYKAVAELDDRVQFLTVAERAQIKAMFDSGDAAGAREKVFKAYARHMDEMAKKSRGEWSDAFEALGRGVDSLLDRFANTRVIQGFSSAIKSAVNNIGEALTANTDADAQLVQRRIDALNRVRTNREKNGNKVDTVGDPYLMKAEEDELAALKARSAELKRQQGITGDLVDAESAAAKKRRADTLAQISDEERLQQLRDTAAKDQRALSAAESSERAALAGKLAYQEALNASGDKEIAKAKLRNAVEHELAQIQQQNRQATQRAQAEREREIRQFENRVIGAEGGAAKNPRSSAQGFGQFIDSTWIEQFRKVNADAARTLSEQQILALRQNQTVAKAIISNYAHENASFLERFGAKVTAGNLYLAHFLGPDGARKVLQAAPGTSVDSLVGPKAMAANPEYLRTDGGRGRARTASELISFIGNRVGDTGAAESAGQVEIAKLIEDAAQAQDEFNLKVQQANDERRRSIDALKVENTLQGDKLLAAQREIAIAKAEFDLRKQVEDANKNLKPGQTPVVLSDEQVQRTKDLAAAEWDLSHARERAQAKTDDSQRKMADLTAERDALVQQAQVLRSLGDGAGADALLDRIRSINGELLTAIDDAIMFLETLDPDTDPLHRTREAIDAAITGLRTLRAETAGWHDEMAFTARNLQDSFSGSLTDSVKGFAKSIAEGKNVFESFGQAALSFASSFLQKLADMVAQMLAFKAASALGFNNFAGGLNSLLGFGGGGFNAAGAISGASSALKNLSTIVPFAHGGGIAGKNTGISRPVNIDWIAHAVRYHGGGIAGLRPDEVPTILQRGEEILTRANPRHSDNLQGAGGGPNVKIVNAFDHGQVLSEAMNTDVGQRAIINFVRSNKHLVNSALGNNR